MGKKIHQKDLFLAALLTQSSVGLAAKTVGISDATATRWLKEPKFKQEYAEARRATLAEAMACVQQAMLGAVGVLRHVMMAPETKASTKVQAARSLLELGLRTFEVEHIERKLDMLVAQMEVMRAHYPGAVTPH